MSDDYVPWGQREGWSDIVPIEQDDGPADLPVIQIPYTAECTHLSKFSLFYPQTPPKERKFR